VDSNLFRLEEDFSSIQKENTNHLKSHLISKSDWKNIEQSFMKTRLC